MLSDRISFGHPSQCLKSMLEASKQRVLSGIMDEFDGQTAGVTEREDEDPQRPDGPVGIF